MRDTRKNGHEFSLPNAQFSAIHDEKRCPVCMEKWACVRVILEEKATADTALVPSCGPLLESAEERTRCPPQRKRRVEPRLFGPGGHKMNVEYLKKDIGKHFRIRPLPERWDDTRQLASLDERWSLDDVTQQHIKITNLSTGHSKEIGADNVREYRGPDFLLLRCHLIIRKRALEIEPILRPNTILSDEQEQLLRSIAGYQQRFHAPKLMIARDGTGISRPENGTVTWVHDANIALDLFGLQKPQARRSVDFEIVMDSLPSEYLRRIPESLWDNPFVVAVTPEGFSYLGMPS